MPIDPSAIGATTKPHLVEWNDRDTMLYALGVGAGTDDLALKNASTASTRRWSSSAGGSVSLEKMLVTCFSTARSVITIRVAIA